MRCRIHYLYRDQEGLKLRNAGRLRTTAYWSSWAGHTPRVAAIHVWQTTFWSHCPKAAAASIWKQHSRAATMFCV